MEKVKVFSALVFSLIVLAFCIYIISCRAFPAEYDKWAFGIIGVIVGYWLH